MPLDSKPDESTEQTSESITPDETAEIKNPSTEGPPSIVPHIPPTPPNSPPTSNASRDNTPTWKKVLEFIAIGIAIALLIVNVLQTFATKKAADAAKVAADTATDTLRKSVEQFRIDERAWIEIERIESSTMSVEVGNKIINSFRYRLYPKNVGKTAAHDVAVNAARNMQTSIRLESNADDMRRAQESLSLNILPKEARENPVPRVLAPGATAAVPFVLDGQEPQIFSKDEWVSYLIGRIDYADDFGVKHWMKFCFYVGERNGQLWNCHEGNDEDQNPETTPNKP
jgi:hypothetical protein